MTRRFPVILALVLWMPLVDAAAPQSRGRSAPSSPSTFQVPAGAPLLLKLVHPLDAASAREGDQVDAELWSPVIQQGVELIPEGSRVLGQVDAVTIPKEAPPSVSVRFSVIEHPETRSLASIRTRDAVLHVPAVLPPPKKRSDTPAERPVIAAGTRLTAVLAEPLIVRIKRPEGR